MDIYGYKDIKIQKNKPQSLIFEKDEILSENNEISQSIHFEKHE